MQALVLLPIDQNKTNTSDRQKKVRDRQRFFFHSGLQLCPGLMLFPQAGGREHCRLGKEGTEWYLQPEAIQSNINMLIMLA